MATVAMMVCIAVVADIAGIVGGMLVGRGFLGLGFRLFLQHTVDALAVKDFLTGLFKAGVFGGIISSFACYLGLSVTGGAQGVGAATTRTVVLTIVALIFTDLLFTATFYFLGL